MARPLTTGLIGPATVGPATGSYQLTVSNNANQAVYSSAASVLSDAAFSKQ